MKVSVIVCTRDRREQLQTLLESLTNAERSSDIDLELIVVDDGSTDATPATVKQFARSAPIRVRLVHQPGRGLSAARNRGLQETRGDLLLFVDDDCVVSRGYFREAIARFAADDGPVLRGGRVLLGDPADAPLTIKTSLNVEHLGPHHEPGGFLLGANMGMSRQVAAMIGPFDERFGAGGVLRSAEDTDYFIRAQLAGVRVEYVPDMVVSHFHGRRTPEAIRRVQRGYNIGNGALAMKYLFRAPWLWRYRYWTLRNAVRELLGGPPFDPHLGLSHIPMVAENFLGAWLFILAKLRGAAPWPQAAHLEPAKAPASA